MKIIPNWSLIFLAIIRWAMLGIRIVSFSYSERCGQSMHALWVCHSLFFISTTWQVWLKSICKSWLCKQTTNKSIRYTLQWTYRSMPANREIHLWIISYPAAKHPEHSNLSNIREKPVIFLVVFSRDAMKALAKNFAY